MAQFDEPTCSSKRHRGQCRVPRRPAARTRHKAGVVSRVPRGSRSAQAFGTDRNTYQTNLTPATKYGHPRATDRKELTIQKDNERKTLTFIRSGYAGALASVVILLVKAGDASPCPCASRQRTATRHRVAWPRQVLAGGAGATHTRARWIASRLLPFTLCRRNLPHFDGDTGDNGDTAPTLNFSAFANWGHAGDRWGQIPGTCTTPPAALSLVVPGSFQQIARGSTNRPSFGVSPLVREDVHPRRADARQARLLCRSAIAAGHDPALRQQTLRRDL